MTSVGTYPWTHCPCGHYWAHHNEEGACTDCDWHEGRLPDLKVTIQPDASALDGFHIGGTKDALEKLKQVKGPNRDLVEAVGYMLYDISEDAELIPTELTGEEARIIAGLCITEIQRLTGIELSPQMYVGAHCFKPDGISDRCDTCALREVDHGSNELCNECAHLKAHHDYNPYERAT